MLSLIKKIKKYRKTNVLIYQMAKVGSSAIEKAVPDAIQLHTLYFTPPCPVHTAIAYPSFLKLAIFRLSLVFKRNLIRCHKRVKIITIIRDPFERNMSMFFQSLIYWMVGHQIGIPDKKVRVGGRIQSKNYLEQCFNDVFPHDYPVKWFDRELCRFTGINVYNQDFDKDKGYAIYKKGRYEVLLLEFNKISEAATVIGDFVGKEVVIERVNDSNKKWYSQLYQEFKESYDYSKCKAYVTIKSSRYFEKYYS